MSTPASAAEKRQPLTIGEAARRLGVHRETLRAAIERGEVPAARLGRRWLVPAAAIEALLNGRPGLCGGSDAVSHWESNDASA